ncbi:MAG: serine hydrolase domain-containing protein [Pacificimonas sp.]
MRISSKLILVPALLLAGACAAPQAVVAPEVAPLATTADIDLRATREAARTLIAEGTVANVVVGIATRSGGTTWLREGTLAFDNPTPADEQSLYRIYSMTKPITGLTAAILIAEGKLGLDQPISEIIPEFADPQVLVDKDVFGATRPAAREITVRDLMTHMSGLGYSIIPSALSEEYAKAGVVPGWRRDNPLRPTGPQPADLQEFATRIAGLPLRTDPGTEWHYSVGLDVLGAVIERVEGKPFPAVLKERIFDPLGMDDTAFVVRREDIARLTDNYVNFNGQIVPFDPAANSEYLEPAPFPAGGAGLASTAEDYLRLMRAMAEAGRLNGRQVLPAAAVELALQNLLPDGGSVDAFQYLGTGFGAGGRVAVAADGPEPIGSWGWGGAASTIATAMPNEDIAYVVMTQLMLAGDKDVRTTLFNGVNADLAPLIGDTE